MFSAYLEVFYAPPLPVILLYELVRVLMILKYDHVIVRKMHYNNVIACVQESTTQSKHYLLRILLYSSLYERRTSH